MKTFQEKNILASKKESKSIKGLKNLKFIVNVVERTEKGKKLASIRKNYASKTFDNNFKVKLQGSKNITN